MSIGVRWTVGDVSPRGWEALRLSVHCAVRLFGADTAYCIGVNNLPLAEAQQRTGSLPSGIGWRELTSTDIPAPLGAHLDASMAEGAAWKLVPLRLFPDRHELSLDNDCLLWDLPDALREWLGRSDATLLATDVERCLGQFQGAAVSGAVNSGIRGLPPGFPFDCGVESALKNAAAARGSAILLTSELDEQGLQAAALDRSSPLLRVRLDEVSICSPFWPRNPELGTCGAHFVGLNPRTMPWDYYGRPGQVVRAEHWDRHRAELYLRAGLGAPPETARAS